MIVTKQSLATLEAWKHFFLYLQAGSPSRFPVPGIAAGHQVLVPLLTSESTMKYYELTSG